MKMDKWITVWSQSHTNIKTVTPQYRNRTMWLTVPVPLTGDSIRLRISNREGCTKLRIRQAALWLEGERRHPLTFRGRESLALDMGEEAYSDDLPIAVSVGRLVSVAVAFEGHPTSGNCIAAHVQCSKNGNFVYAPQMDISRRSFMDSYWGNLPGIPAVAAVEVRTEERPDVIVCFGDSITQQSTWTVPLERMLQARGRKSIVLNAGIGGNRLLLGPPEPALQVFGPAAMERFERDVLQIPGVTSVILALGTNDIGWIRKPEDIITAGAEPVFAGLKALADLAHRNRLQVYGATLTPRVGSWDYSPEQEAERLKLNSLIREADCIDRVMDFAGAIADNGDSAIMAPHCDSGDHLHPSALGGYQMAAHACEILLRT